MMNFTDEVQALILDMDGVLWRADSPIGDLPAAFASLERKGYAALLATNNSTRTVDQYLDTLANLGVFLEPWQIVTSSEAVGDYLQAKYPQGGPVYVVGEDGLLDAMRRRGFYIDTHQALAVVAGMDRQVTYQKIAVANRLIRSGALYIGTNPDKTFPTPDGLIPGAGAIIIAIAAAAGVEPLILGKPKPYLYQLGLQRLGLQPEQVLVVGDRLDTDIAGAQEIGCRTALVLSGVTNQADAQAWQPPPDWIGADLTTLVAQLPARKPWKNP
jgi:4-nitrophenyl phosphatase